MEGTLLFLANFVCQIFGKNLHLCGRFQRGDITAVSPSLAMKLNMLLLWSSKVFKNETIHAQDQEEVCRPTTWTKQA
jgi:hypothetical protein